MSPPRRPGSRPARTTVQIEHDPAGRAPANGGAWVYLSFGGVSTGWHIIGGTSEASPIFAGIVALADQVAGHRLGLINPGLYLLGTIDAATIIPWAGLTS